jgi:hypothetical protein
MSKVYDYVINNEVNKNVLKSIVAAEGGEESWETIFEGDVTTTQDIEDASFTRGQVDVAPSADSIKVTFNDEVFTVNKQSDGFGDYYGEADENGSPIFDTYPFLIASSKFGAVLLTSEVGTYSLKIEEPTQSGGSEDSEFSVANVVVKIPEFSNFTLTLPVIKDNAITVETQMRTDMPMTYNYSVPLYKGTTIVSNEGVESVSGNITNNGTKLIITGDGVINMLKN